MRRSTCYVWIGVVVLGLAISGDLWCEDPPPGETASPYRRPTEVPRGLLEGTLDPDAYILGAGDVLEVGFWGDVNRRETVTVNPDGDVLIAPVGPVDVDGLTLSEVRAVVRQKLSAYYRPSILSVSLISIRSFQVHVVGMVGTPGAVEVTAVTRASQAVDLAGGLSPGASQRNITISRGSDVVPVDLTSYLLLGDNDVNPSIQEGDVVYVPPMLGGVHVFGSVYRPRTYEFVDGETLDRIVRLAGGFRPDAFRESIEIQRFSSDDPTVSEAIYLPAEEGALAGFEVKLDDRIFVRSLLDWHVDAKVEVLGEVRYPGVYVIEDGVETLSEVIERAGGFTERASLAEGRLIRGAYAGRRFPIENELDALKEMQSSSEGKDRDLVKTMSREPKGNVSMNFESVFLDEAAAIDPHLYDGDVIDVPPVSWFVRVAGHVRSPGLVRLTNGETYKYYIRQAGGFASGADTRGTRLIRADGGQRVKPGGEEIRPGDIIWVPMMKDRDWWQITKDVLQVLAQIATIYVVADQISSR